MVGLEKTLANRDVTIDPGCKLEPCLGMMLVPDAEGKYRP